MLCVRAAFKASSGDSGVFSFLSSWNNSLEALNDWYEVNALINGIVVLFGRIYLTLCQVVSFIMAKT